LLPQAATGKPEQTQAAVPPAVPASVAEVREHDATQWSEFSGRLEAVDFVEVRPRVAGAIVATHFREGALVKKGEPLFTIDPDPYAAEVQRLEAQISGAEARVELATLAKQRAERLAPNSTITASELDNRVNEFKAAGAALQAVKAELARARLDLGYTEVRAPIDGRIGRFEVTAGNLVAAGPGAPVLTTLVSTGRIYATCEVDELTITRALAALPAGGEISSIPVTIQTLADDGQVQTGALQFVDNIVDVRSGTVRVRAQFDNPGGRLRPGQYVKLRVGQPNPRPTIAIDERAIGTDQDRRFVLVVGGDNRVAYRRVALGEAHEGLRVVKSGLNQGERIVVDGLQRLQPGALIEPHEVAMQAALNEAVRR